jgi:hypothetical protein
LPSHSARRNQRSAATGQPATEGIRICGAGQGEGHPEAARRPTGFWGMLVARNAGGFGPASKVAFGVDAFGGPEGERGQERGVHRRELGHSVVTILCVLARGLAPVDVGHNADQRRMRGEMQVNALPVSAKVTRKGLQTVADWMGIRNRTEITRDEIVQMIQIIDKRLSDF